MPGAGVLARRFIVSRARISSSASSEWAKEGPEEAAVLGRIESLFAASGTTDTDVAGSGRHSKLVCWQCGQTQSLDLCQALKSGRRKQHRRLTIERGAYARIPDIQLIPHLPPLGLLAGKSLVNQ